MLNKLKQSRFFMEVLLVGTTFFWGMTYIWNNDIAVLNISISGFASIRYAICAVMLLPFFWKDLKKTRKKDIGHGIFLGGLYYIIAVVQIWALEYTTPANSAFIFSAYVIIVPVFAWFVLRIKPQKKIIVAIMICLAGIYLLNMTPGESLRINSGNLISILGAALLALQMVYISHAVKETSVGIINVLPVSFCCIISTVIALFTDGFDFSGVGFWDLMEPTLMLAVFGTVISGVCQAYAQKFIDANRAAVIYSLESLFACLMSVLLGYEDLTVTLVVGGCLIIGAILFMELKSEPKSLE